MATMLTYAYTGRDLEGKLIKGKVDALTETQVAARLRTMGLSPVAIKAASANAGLNMDIKIGFGSGVKLKDLAVMARQMATMIGAGLTILKSLTILADQTPNSILARALATIRDDVETGTSLSEAMIRHDDKFPPIMINMVRAGELGGFLDEALDTIATNFEKEVKLRGAIKSAMTYPVMVLLMSLASVAVMLIFIVPIFAKMYGQFKAQLPAPTEILIGMSHAAVFIVPAIAVVGIAFAFWWSKNKRTERVRSFVDPLKLRLPVFGSLIKKIAIARFARNFANMISSGVPILQALKIVGETSGNWAIEKALERVADAVRRGESVSAPILEETVFPPMVTQMMAVGEDSGSMEIMLVKIGDFYDEEVKSMTESLTSMIEPLLIGFLGVVVGGMIIALYMPIFDLSKVVH